MFIKEHARMMFNENAHEIVFKKKEVDDVVAVIVSRFQIN